jgi:hypothetical protein
VSTTPSRTSGSLGMRRSTVRIRSPAPGFSNVALRAWCQAKDLGKELVGAPARFVVLDHVLLHSSCSPFDNGM